MTAIAIVGRACVLPGALSPEELWQAVLAGRDLTRSVLPGRWRLSPQRALCNPLAPAPERTWSDRGGYVTGFDAIWNPHGLALPAAQLAGLDPLVHWTLHCARLALGEARVRGPRVGAVLGNLGFPSEQMAAFADQVWHGQGQVDPRNRAMSGGTAALLAQALQLNAGSYCLDAACASSLYAIALACQRLEDGVADLMLAGAVQRADDLFLHQGFAALGALSKSGQSRPFHHDADGLLPAEGCAILALKRVDDARRDGDTIHALIRGIGLSNDGRGKGLLVPDESGQQRAMQAAYRDAGIDPCHVSLLECHATGTPVGDAAELRSSAQIYAGAQALPIGSLKSNMGHLITVAGAAGLIKLIEALRHGVRPPNRAVDAPTAVLRETPFRLLQQAEAWPDSAPRIAAISAFGFGGNNAHLVISADAQATALSVGPRAHSNAAGQPAGAMARDASDDPIAIVGLGIALGAHPDRRAVTQALFAGVDWQRAGQARMDAITLDLAGLRFPPRDLEQALPQQLALLQVARAALAETCALPAERTAVLVGMEPDAEVARFGSRWRLAESGQSLDWIRSAQDALIAPLQAAGVLGCMPNIPANRLNAQFDFGGPGYTLQAGAESGLQALRIAARALRRGQIDAALVGAVDLCCEPVNCAAGNAAPADAAVALVLKRLGDAERDGDRVYALLQPPGAVHPDRAADAADSERTGLRARVGDAGAAGGLLEAALGALCLHHRRTADGRPALTQRDWPLALSGLADLRLRAAPGASRRSEVESPRLHVYAGADKAAVIAAVAANQPGQAGPARLVLVGRDDELPALRARALAHLREGAPAGHAIHFREQPISGEIAFVFAGAGASYAGMGRELLEHLPQLHEHLAARSQRLATALAWSFDPAAGAPSAVQQLWGASALSQLHLELSERVLGLKADAWIGYSSGETNALVAAGVWNDPDALMAEMEASGLVSEQLGGAFRAVAPQWGRPVHWASWTILAPVAAVRAALAGVQRVHLAIINSDADCLIAGDAEGCAQVVAQIGASRCLQLDYPLAVHVPELHAVADAWLDVHRRDTRAPRHGRIYGNALGRAYTPDRERCARAILDQATTTLDLRPVVLQAWNDGVRVFIEHGPGNSFARAIRNTLGEREALVLSIDRKSQGLEGALGMVAALVAAGVRVDYAALQTLLAPAVTPAAPQRPRAFAAHWPTVVLPPVPAVSSVQRMQRAPALPSARVMAARSAEDRLPAALAPALARASSVIPIASAPLAARADSAALWTRVQHQITDLGRQQQSHGRILSAAHQHFLAVRAQAQDLLLRAATPMRLAATSVAPQANAAPIAPPLPAPPVAAARAAPSAAQPATGPRFTRAQLEQHADGRISELFGPAFAGQDDYLRQVRMPRPPLLLADRVTAIEGAPGVLGRGRICTETDVSAEAWYLQHGHMAAGVMIEAGQADLMLVSWQGVDAYNRGERVYRLLGCELTYHGDLPVAGDTLRFDIHLDGHAAQGDVRLMFFHYDCVNGDRAQLSVRGGQAGFFTDAELAASAGCLWSPQTQAINPAPQWDPPAQACTAAALNRTQLLAFAAGDTASCFGPGFELARTHTRSPGIGQGRLLLIDRVSELAINGGPWQRGYLRAEFDIAADQWFFDGHFKNDPCMPGTLMFEGCLQAMAVYLAACGYALQRDGWRFQPVPGLPYQLQCRGQVTPRSRLLVTEVFVEERIAGPQPTIYADLLCSVDGLKAFHARRVALQLVPDWPLARRAPPGADAAGAEPFQFDPHSLQACALGRPSEAFGPMYARFDGPTRVARLPASPYHFISRIAELTGAVGVLRAGARVVAEYAVPADAWFLADNSSRVMPYAVLLEVALQPCGWLSSYVGSALTVDSELGFRNLDGDGVVLAEVLAGDTVTTTVELSDVSAGAGMIIEKFSVVCRVGAREVYRLRTVFGFFPPAALAAQAGLAVSAAQGEWLARPANRSVILDAAPASVADTASARLPRAMLRMIDQIDGCWPQAGAAGLGQVRALKAVDPGEWFFKAHFFQDPVQPGSLGMEAMLQTLQWWMLDQGLDAAIAQPRFECMALGHSHRWKYRGQVLPQHRQLTTTLEITACGRDERGRYALADASLWVDGQRIYEAFGLGVRIVAA